MATYKEIKGVTVQTFDEDPVTAGGSWSSASPINTARFQTAGAGATQGAAYIIGGAIPGTSPNIRALHEQFDGSSWTEAGDLGVAKYALATFGTTTSALTASGYDGDTAEGLSGYTKNVESWNGSSWSETTDTNNVRGYLGASGPSNTSGVIYGGLYTAYVDYTETWNGSAWTETGDLNTARGYVGQTNNGTTTAAMCSGGGSPPLVTSVEQFN